MQPSFSKFPLEKETYGSVGGNVTIPCRPEAAPKPEFEWRKDGLRIGKFKYNTVCVWWSKT